MELIEYLPFFYRNSVEVLNIQNSINDENEKIQLDLKELLDQLFIDTATWGIDFWEKYLGIEIDRSESLENRRSRLMTRLRGQGTTTKEMINNICRSFTGGEVDIIENNENYFFIIKFIGVDGIPNNLNYLKGAIKEVKPAHLNVIYEMKYLIIDSVENMTLNDLQNTKMLLFSPFVDK